MPEVTVQPPGADPFVAWRDGAPTPALPVEARAEAEQLIARQARLGLTIEGPFVDASWATVEQAVAVLVEVYPDTAVLADPPLALGPREHSI